MPLPHLKKCENDGLRGSTTRLACRRRAWGTAGLAKSVPFFFVFMLKVPTTQRVYTVSATNGFEVSFWRFCKAFISLKILSTGWINVVIGGNT